MVSENGLIQPPPNATVTSLGVDHVRLSYLYLDEGDLDGLLSLLTNKVLIKWPHTPTIRSREEAGRILRDPRTPRGRHCLYQVFGQAGSVAAVGRFNPLHEETDRGVPGVDFVDIFTLSEQGLIMGQRRFITSI